jgi:DnaJ like chaperone protein
MASFSHVALPLFAMPQLPKVAQVAQPVAQQVHASAVFSHAVVALVAKLVAVDGTPNKAEYSAFQALFGEGDAVRDAHARSLFVKRVADTSPALQYARQIASVTEGNPAIQHDLMQRLLRVATADAALNAAELELLRAVARILGIDRQLFRDLVAQTMVPVSASPYEVLGVSPRVSDQDLREHYMGRVQKLHPDRYQAAGASAETIAMLSDQLASVNAAYRAIQELRAKKASRSSAAGGWWSRINAKGAKVSST